MRWARDNLYIPSKFLHDPVETPGDHNVAAQMARMLRPDTVLFVRLMEE